MAKINSQNSGTLRHKISQINLFLLVFFIDQFSKWYVVSYIFTPDPGKKYDIARPFSMADFLIWFLRSTKDKLEYVEVKITGFFNLAMVWNYGMSFGILNNKHLPFDGPVLLLILSSTIVFLFAIWFFRTTSRVQGYAIALIMAGALGNIWDRVRFGAVVDFLDFHIGRWHWPAFNAADSAVCIGVGILLIHSFVTREHQSS